MQFSLLAKLSIAAAATMLTLSPALAHGSHSHHRHGYHQSYGKSTYHSHGKRKHARHFHRHRHHSYHRRHVKPRFYNAWRYGYRPYRW